MRYRISTDPKDPGYHPEAYKAKVYLDGKKLDFFITTDMSTGEAWVMEFAPLGEEGVDYLNTWGINLHCLWDYRIKRLTGDVRIETDLNL